MNKRLAGIVLAIALILLVTAIAMLFTTEVNWTATDFIAAAILLLGAGLACELVLRKVKATKHRIIICVIILLLLLLLWAELAIGIFNSLISGS